MKETLPGLRDFRTIECIEWCREQLKTYHLQN